MTAPTQLQAAYDYLKAREGQTFHIQELADVTGWKATTVQTYIGKKWSNYLKKEGLGRFKVEGFASLDFDDFAAIHTQVYRPAPSPEHSQVHMYEVGLSFAGEDREYVGQVAHILHKYGVEVFYDEFVQGDFWGKNLYEYLEDVYRRRCRYCVMFISEHYARKVWPSHERRSAQARAFEEHQDYILPVRIDDTELPGLHSTVAYLNANQYSPLQLAVLIMRKLGKYDEVEGLMAYIKRHLGDNCTIVQTGGDIEIVTLEEGEPSYFGPISVSALLELAKCRRLRDFLAPYYYQFDEM